MRKLQNGHNGWKWLSLLLLILISASLYFRHLGSIDSEDYKIPQDFGVYLQAREHLRQGQSPYVTSVYSQYRYAPSAVLPFYLLPESEKTAWLVFKALLILMWTAGIWIGTSFDTPKKFGFLVLGILLSWKGLLETLDYGQLEFAFFFFGILATRLLKTRPWISGLILGTLPWIKLPWGFLLIPFAGFYLWKKEFHGLTQLLIGAAASTLFWVILAPLASFGWSSTLLLYSDWFMILENQPKTLYWNEINQGLNAALLRLFGPEQSMAAFIPYLLLSVFFIWRLLKTTMKQRSSSTEPMAWVAPWLLLAQIVSPLSWRWSSLVLTGIPFAFPTAGFIRNRKVRIALYCLLGVSFFFLQNAGARVFGYSHWTELNPYSSVLIHWMIAFLLVL